MNVGMSRRLVALAVAAAACIGGCVPPGEVDPELIGRYQRAMAGRGPQLRGSEGLGQLQPAPGDPPVPLTVEAVRNTDGDVIGAKVLLSLDEAVRIALANNVDIRVVSYDPAISREQMIQAAAAFDYTFFGGYNFDETDLRTASIFGGGRSTTHAWEVGLSQTAITGGTWALTYDLSRINDSSGLNVLSPRYQAFLTWELTQPLLRGAWPEYNLATLRVARLSYKSSMSSFRQKVEEVVTDVISTYWELVQARGNVAIQENLLRLTQDTLDKVTQRAGLDATAVEISQSKAAVETRRAALILARKQVYDVQDALAKLLAHNQLNMLNDYEVIPTTDLAVTELNLDVGDQLMTALQYNPQMEQARLAIATADINVRVAENETLPSLDLTFSISENGLDRYARGANDIMWANNYLGYAVGIQLEYPIGNRARISALRQQRLLRRQALSSIQDTADTIAVTVRERIRQVRTSYREYQAQKAAVEAARVQLQALEDTERIRGRLTPEFLQVKLQAQQTLASNESSLLAAEVDYNVALAELAQATGTVLELNRVRMAMPAMVGETADGFPGPKP